MTVIPFLIAGILLVLIILGSYIFKNYVAPKKLEELETLIKEGNPKLAIKKLQELLEKDEKNPYVHYLLALAYEKMDNPQMAIMEYRQVLKIARFEGKLTEKAVRYRLAKLLLENKHYDDALKEFLILTKIDATNYEAYREVGRIYFLSHRYDKAIPYLRQAVKLNPNDYESYYALGEAEYYLNKYPEAKSALSSCIKLNPKHSKAHYYLGLILKHFKDYEFAIKEFEFAEKDPDIKPKALLAKGLCYLERNQFSKAIVEFERGLKSAKKGSETHLNLAYFLADAYEKLRDIPPAIELWEEIHKISPKFRDVAEKLKQYEDFKLDDNLKDFMIASITKFEEMCKKISKAMDIMPLEMELVDDSTVSILGIESGGRWKSARKNKVVLKILRTTDPVPDSIIRKIHEELKANGAVRGICIATSDFTPTAKAYVQSRPIDLYGKKEIAELLKKAETMSE